MKVNHLGVVFAVLLALPVAGAEWFVDAVGGADGEGRGGSAATALKTIQAAVDAAAAGDVVTILPGDYAEGFRSRTDGGYTSRSRVYVDKPLTLRSQGGRATRDATRILGAWDSTGSTAYPDGMGPEAVRCVWVTAAGAGSRFEGLTFENGAAPYYSGGASGHSCGGGLYVGGEKAATVVDCAFRRCQATRGGGIYSDKGAGAVTAARSLFKRCRATKYGQAGRGVLFYNCVLDDNGPTRLADGTPKGDDTMTSAGATSYSSLIVNCTVVNSGYGGIGYGGKDYATGVFNCISLNNGGNAVSVAVYDNLVSDRAGYTENNSQVVRIYESSEVVDTRAEDYRLVKGARAASVGSVDHLSRIPAEFRDTDYYGNPRVTDGVVHAGAVQEVLTETMAGLNLQTGFAAGALLLDGEPLPCDNRVIVQKPGPYGVFDISFAPKPGWHLVGYYVSETRRWPLPDDSAWLSNVSAGRVQSVVPQATQTAYWTDPAAGDDEAGDGSEAQPWRTLQKAVESVTGDAVVHAKPGDYAEGGARLEQHASRVAVPATLSGALRVKAVAGPAGTFITGAVGAGANGIGDDACRCIAVATTKGVAAIQGFTLRDGRTGGTAADASNTTYGGALVNNVTGNNTAVLLDCVVTNCTGGRGAAAYGGELFRCRVENCRIVNAGILRRARAYSCLFRNCTSGGAALFCDNAKLYNCTVVDNPVNVIAEKTATGGKAYVYNSVVARRSNAAFATISTVLEDDQVCNTLYDTTAEGQTFSTSVAQNPVAFRDVAAGDWSIYADSPGARLASTAYWGALMDFNGRPFLPDSDGRYEVGAFACAAAATYYADAERGDDANDGLSEATAVRTLAAALAKAKRWDVVVALPGVYDAGTMLQTKAQAGGSVEPVVPARAVVGEEVTLVSRDGAEATVIEGASDGGTCGPNAVRCVFLCRDAVVRGFTLRGGYTDNGGDAMADNVNTHGGGVLGYQGAAGDGELQGLVEDCLITGCQAARGGGANFGTYRNCRFVGNSLCVNKPGSAARLARLEGCYLAGNAGSHSTAYQCDVRNCTVMGGQADGSGVVLIESSYLPLRAVVNSVILDTKYAARAVTNCVFATGCQNKATGDLLMLNCVTGTVGLAADGRPVRGSLVVDAGDASVTSDALLTGCDAAGLPRVSNGRLDVGAFEYDWRPDFAAALSPKGVSVAEADPSARLVDGAVVLPSGDLVVDWTLSDAAPAYCTVNVTGTGTLTVMLDGEPVESVAAPFAGELVLRPGKGAHRLVFHFERDGEGGGASLASFRQPNGTAVILR